MSAEIRLTFLPSLDEVEQQYTFTSAATCTLGRSEDCTIVVPHGLLHTDVSRHHCELRIDPPRVAVRDLQSLNGTFVNKSKIGQRFQEEKNPAMKSGQLVLLNDGDELRLGRETAYRVEIRPSL
jgi:pSer/pThr/pTyr-binding forkhead associated (FHA) protein